MFKDFKVIKLKSTIQELQNKESDINKFINRFNHMAKFFDIKNEQPLPNKEIGISIYVWNTPSNIHIVGRGILMPKLVHYQISQGHGKLFTYTLINEEDM